MRYFLGVALLFLCATVGAQPKIAGDVKYDYYKVVQLRAENLVPKAGALWFVAPDTVSEAVSPKGMFQFTAAPGVYKVTLVEISHGAEGNLSVVKVSTNVTIGVPPKPDPPGPKPDPVDPDNTPSKLFLVVVEETADAVAERGAMFSDKDLAARVKDKGHSWRVVDQNVVGQDGQPPADAKRFLDAAKGKKLPQLFLVDPKGKTRFSGDLPTKAADLIQLLNKYGG